MWTVSSNKYRKLYIDEQTFVPCTPLGIMEILKHADIDLEGKMQL